jgi:hypothetical protein
MALWFLADHCVSNSTVQTLRRRAAGSAQGSRTGRLHLFLKFFFGLHIGRLNLSPCAVTNGEHPDRLSTLIDFIYDMTR